MKQRPWRNLVVVLGLLAGMVGVAPASRAPAALAQAREPATLYVQPGGTSTTCSSWSDACELQAALGVAQSGDEIWVAEGTYLPDYDPITETHTGDRSESFQLVNGVALYGGFAGTEENREERDWAGHATILSGDLNGDDGADFANYTDNSYHVVGSSGVIETAVLDGFGISGGNADGSSPHDSGGGMHNGGSSPTLAHITFSNNAARYGGGMYNDNSSPVLTNVIFRNNNASGTDAGDGGGMNSAGNSQPVLTNVIFTNNTATRWGGGMSNGQSNPVLTNVIFSGNSAAELGGAIFNWDSSPTLTNCILWGDAPTGMANPGTSAPVVSYSDIQGGHLGEGNIDADPLFVDAAGSNLRLQLTSPAIDAGNNDAPGLVGITTDLGGHPRFADVLSVPDTGYGDAPIVDMGAYETIPPSDIVYVDREAAGANDGSSWKDAFTDLQDALSWALHSAEIWVAAGTYTPGTVREATFRLVPGVAVYGGFDPSVGAVAWGDRDRLSNLTVLSGDIGNNDTTDPHGVITDTANITGANSYHVVTSSSVTETAVLDGFTVTGGNADSWPDPYGGGMYNENSSPTLSNITFTGNSATNGGGGMYNADSSPTLSNITFTSNSAAYAGGGMYNADSSPTLSNCTFDGNSAYFGNGGGMFNGGSNPMLTHVTFTGNSADLGGGMFNDFSSPTLTLVTFTGNSADFGGGGMFNADSSPTLTNCTFSDNTAESDSPGSGLGGGMLNAVDSSATLTHVTFTGNTAGQHGGGMFNENSSPTLSHATFQGNSATSGGGMYIAGGSTPPIAPTLTNCSFWDNEAYTGGGVYNESGSPSLTNVTLAGNLALSAGGGMFNSDREGLEATPTISNSIVWGNTPDQISNSYTEAESNTTIGYSDVQGGCPAGSTCDQVQDADPRFVDAAGGNLRLQIISPAIDAGDNRAVPAEVTTDLAGYPRFVDVPSVDNTGVVDDRDPVDMGAYEAQYVSVYLPLIVRASP